MRRISYTRHRLESAKNSLCEAMWLLITTQAFQKYLRAIENISLEQKNSLFSFPLNKSIVQSEVQYFEYCNTLKQIYHLPEIGGNSQSWNNELYCWLITTLCL